MPNEIELAYMAGIVDGEGSIGIVGSFAKYRVASGEKKYQRYSVRVTVYNTKVELLEWIKQRFGGSWTPVSRKNYAHAPYYAWYVGHTKAAELANLLMPYLVIKRKQAEIIVKFAETFSHRHARGTPKNILEMRDGMRSEMTELNRRGNRDALVA